ncbi:kinesin-like protein KIF20B [Trichomycterus rosablanca]|uniref:kinesin-like protein KIF20B n=1 Tax=Trichomycterus rosablanca TaxID=2290929 RepID=UPI002F35B2C9
MESCLNYKPERVGSVTVEDLRKDLFEEFSKIPATQAPVLLEKEHLHVYLRIRPFTSSESEFGKSQDCISIEAPDTVVLKAPRFSLSARQSEKLGPQVAQRFQFSKVYGPETSQRQIFDGTTKSLVKDVLAGENSLVFTYGVTNTGKTFTFLGPESDGGILPRSLNVIFNSIEGRIYNQNNIKPHRCIDFTRLTRDQQEEEAKMKRNLLRRYKENDLQKSSSSMSSSAGSTILEGKHNELEGDSLCLEEDSCVKFSVWVSFCEIYNENIHDLLDFISNSSQRRSVLRLCQDVKGNTFVKDLTWVQVNSADEAYKVLKIGRKNQSFSSTKLNSVSSRSHSIFSIRILRIEDLAVPRVQSISELSLCDLAGSERCAKTQNRGDRLKEAGNINTSLLTLGKCINALRLNETLNVLKFSALAQKVVVVNPKPTFTSLPKKSAREVSMMINNLERREWTRRSTLIGWETSLEDVQEDGDDEEMEEDVEESEEESMVENTVLEAGEELDELQQKIKELNDELSKEQSEKLAMESRIRDEVTAEFMELFSNMEKDYSERIQREKEIAEERAERRMEILRNLVDKSADDLAAVSSADDPTRENKFDCLDGMIESMQHDLAKIKKDAETAQSCLENESHSPGAFSKLKAQLNDMTEELSKNHQLLDIKNKEMEEVQVQLQKTTDKLLEADKNYENQTLRYQKLMAICQEKDEMIFKLQTALDKNVEAANEDRTFIDTVKEELMHYRNNCKCGISDGKDVTENQEMKQLVQALKEKDENLEELKCEQDSLKQKLKALTEDLSKQVQAWEVAISSFETEKAATNKLTIENRSLANKLSVIQHAASDMESRLKVMETELHSQKTEAARLFEELQSAQVLIREHEDKTKEQSNTIKSLTVEAENLLQRLNSSSLSQGQENNCTFQKTIEALRKECETMMAGSLEKIKRIQSLEQELNQIKGEMSQKETLHNHLKKELEENQNLLRQYETERLSVEQMKGSQSELEAELVALRQQLTCLKEQEQTFTQSLEGINDLQKKLEEKRTHCADLEQRLLQLQNNLVQAGEDLQTEQRRRSEEEEKRNVETSKRHEEAERRRDVEGALAKKEEELNAKAQVLLKFQKQVDDGLDTIQSLRCDLQQKEKEISNLHAKLMERDCEMEQQQKRISSLTNEIALLQQKLNVSEKDRDQALKTLASKEKAVDELKDKQDSKNKSQEYEVCQVLLDKEKLIEEMRCTLSDREKAQKEQEQLLEAQLTEIESLSAELMKLKEKYQRGELTTSEPDHSHQDEQNEEKPTGVSATMNELQIEPDDLMCSDESQSPKDFTESQKKILNKTQHEVLTTVQNSSILSTDSERDKRFPKPELEITFTPLKPNHLNVRRPGNEESVTVKIKRTGRKRKSAEIENSVESENSKNMRLRGNYRTNAQCVESPTVLGKKTNQLKQQDSPASLKNRKDGTLQKIGEFIQSSPTLLGSKAKKIMAKVVVKSPDLQNETNNKPKRSKRKLFKTQISSPLDIASHPIIGIDHDNKESDHLIIKRKLRTRTCKK